MLIKGLIRVPVEQVRGLVWRKSGCYLFYACKLELQSRKQLIIVEDRNYVFVRNNEGECVQQGRRHFLVKTVLPSIRKA